MRTSGSDDLYRLIHSLTTEEKGYFKKFALRHSAKGSKHLQLFDAISQQTEFEEASLKKKFSGYTDMKGYLNEMILDALQVFETDPSGQQVILKGIVRINLLIKKGLLNAALKHIDKNIQIAKQQSFPILHSFLLKMESSIKRQTLTDMERIEYLIQLNKESEQAFEQQKLSDTFLMQQYFLVAMYHIKSTIDYKRLLKKHINLPLLTTPQKKGTYVEVLRLSALHKYYALQGNMSELHKTGKHLMQCEELIWSKNKTETNTENLLVAINNFLVSGLELGKFAESDKALRLMQQIPISNEKMRLENTIRYVHIRQVYFWAIGQHKQGLAFSEQMLKEHSFLQKFTYQQRKISSIHLLASLFAMSVGEHQKAVFHLSAFNLFSKKKLFSGTVKSAELLQVLLQFEMQNFDLVKPMALSALKRIDNLTEPETLFLKAFASNAKTPAQLVPELLAQNCPIEIYPCLSISDWLQSKVQRAPLSEIIAARYKARK